MELVYSEMSETKSEAMGREWFIKHRMGRAEKEALIASAERKE